MSSRTPRGTLTPGWMPLVWATDSVVKCLLAKSEKLDVLYSWETIVLCFCIAVAFLFSWKSNMKRETYTYTYTENKSQVFMRYCALKVWIVSFFSPLIEDFIRLRVYLTSAAAAFGLRVLLSGQCALHSDPLIRLWSCVVRHSLTLLGVLRTGVLLYRGHSCFVHPNRHMLSHKAVIMYCVFILSC